MSKCYICHDDSAQYFNKICKCNESLLCDDCLIEINNDNNKIKNSCAICKQKLKLKYTRNYEFYKHLFKYIEYHLFIFVINISIPTFILLNNIDIIKYKENNNISNNINIILYILTILCIVTFKEAIISQTIKFMRINDEIEIEYFYFKYNILNSFFNIIFGFIVIFVESDNMFMLYYSFLFLILYIIPIIIISLLHIIDRIHINISKIIFKYTDKNLVVLKIVENENNNLMDIFYQL